MNPTFFSFVKEDTEKHQLYFSHQLVYLTNTVCFVRIGFFDYIALDMLINNQLKEVSLSK